MFSKLLNAMKKLLIATTNPGKVLEYREILKDLPIELITLKDLDIKNDIEETGSTFEENAVQKARFYFHLSGLPTLSDDAGLEIDYLNGEPGIRSRRWLGYEASDEELAQMALDKLKGVPKEKRGAQLKAVICLIFSGDGQSHVFEGRLRGIIAEKPFGKMVEGYPFRSIFIPEGQGKYLGELPLVAHRKQAVEKALPIIKKFYSSG